MSISDSASRYGGYRLTPRLENFILQLVIWLYDTTYHYMDSKLVLYKLDISTSILDWTRENKSLCNWSPSHSLLSSIRTYQKYAGRTNPFFVLINKFAVLRHRFWSVITGADIPINSQLGGGLLLPHPNGVVINPRAVIGPNCLIFQQVKIGAGSKPGLPNIGGHVDIGAGAKILGGVTIGDHVKIGANSVVVNDVSNNCTVGIPARIINKGD